MTSLRVLALLLPLVFVLAPARAQTCSADDFGAAVDGAGAGLRAYNADAMPKLQARIKALAAKKKWSDAETEDTAVTYLQDERLRKLDETANTLLAKVDTLGQQEPGKPVDCAKLDDLKTAGIELLAVMKAKTTYLISKIDTELATSLVAAAPPQPVAAPPGKAAAQPQPAAPTATPKPDAPPAPVKTAAQPAPPTAAAKKPEPAAPWATSTNQHPVTAPPTQVATLPPPAPVPAPAPDGPRPLAPMTPAPAVLVADEGYTIDEIRDATRGFFGTVSTSLAAVIEHAFQQEGRPTGYILGQEGGGAFLGGLRYGKGLLYVRAGGTQNIFWHGPSVGLDIGAAGAQTMFLVYKMKEPGDLYRVFSGIDGSAFVVGGVGLTLLGGGGMILAPIRSGLGVRVGANIGYLRLTPTQTWNPF